ncbi:ATP-dependent endonuclease [Leptospira kmetyi]|uniref:ATP-dependent endonuclease n=1 Tax=Leptospira kmetyi TaxID=408139 RepID=A0AAD0UTH3_9LEPT|nr:AAA family ATPase [Leptospira kmetyi]AYV57694.1 ATP-dependent endonuclease [Leptospira kmetyi]
MKLVKMELTNIRSYVHSEQNFEKTKVIIGQNDHGKSSILKVLNILFNEIDEDELEFDFLPESVCVQLLPVPKSKSQKDKRITLHLINSKGKKETLYINLKSDYRMYLSTDVNLRNESEEKAKRLFSEMKENNKFILIPAIRDTQSYDFGELLTETMNEYGLSEMVPSKRGGTTSAYRTISKIREEVTRDIGKLVNAKLFPALKGKLGIQTNHELSVIFDVNIGSIAEWVKENVKLSFKIDDKSSIPLGEAGTGIQSAVLLALQQIKNEANKNPAINYLFAIEEPEAFLHPQKQRELYQSIKEKATDNLNYLITTHSPYIVSDTDFMNIGIVRKEGLESKLYTPNIVDDKKGEILNYFNNDINSLVYFADKVIFVEGESDRLIIEEIIKKHYKKKFHNISVIATGGNKNFAPYINLMRAYEGLSIPFLIVTDFDSLTSEADRPIFKGIESAGFNIPNKKKLIDQIDNAVKSGKEEEHRKIALSIKKAIKETGINVFIFPSDVEYSIVTDANLPQTASLLNELKLDSSKADYSKGYDLASIRRHIGSKNIPFAPMDKPPFKRPFIHRKIVDLIDPTRFSIDIKNLISSIEEM